MQQMFWEVAASKTSATVHGSSLLASPSNKKRVHAEPPKTAQKGTTESEPYHSMGPGDVQGTGQASKGNLAQCAMRLNIKSQKGFGHGLQVDPKTREVAQREACAPVMNKNVAFDVKHKDLKIWKCGCACETRPVVVMFKRKATRKICAGADSQCSQTGSSLADISRAPPACVEGSII